MVYPDLGKALCNAGRCSLCGKPFIHTWLQCVQFKPIREVHVTAIIHTCTMPPACVGFPIIGVGNSRS